MSKRKGIRLEDRIKPAPRPQKSNKELCLEEVGAILQKWNCRLVAVPIGAIAEDGRFEYRSSEIRIEENAPQPPIPAPAPGDEAVKTE